MSSWLIYAYLINDEEGINTARFSHCPHCGGTTMNLVRPIYVYGQLHHVTVLHIVYMIHTYISLFCILLAYLQ